MTKVKLAETVAKRFGWVKKDPSKRGTAHIRYFKHLGNKMYGEILARDIDGVQTIETVWTIGDDEDSAIAARAEAIAQQLKRVVGPGGVFRRDCGRLRYVGLVTSVPAVLDAAFFDEVERRAKIVRDGVDRSKLP